MKITIRDDRIVELGSDSVKRILRDYGYMGYAVPNREITGLRAWIIIYSVKLTNNFITLLMKGFISQKKWYGFRCVDIELDEWEAIPRDIDG